VRELFDFMMAAKRGHQTGPGRLSFASRAFRRSLYTGKRYTPNGKRECARRRTQAV